METVHEPVLLNEVVQGLSEASRADISHTKRDLSEWLWYLDGTFGGGGHAKAMLEKFGGKINLIGLDRDPEAVKRGIQSFGKNHNPIASLTNSTNDGQVIIEEANYRDLDKVLAKHGIDKVDMILLDLGISSDELENSGRGFSFLKDEPLLMTMGDPKSYAFTARDIVNRWAEEDIANVIFGYGEDRYARRIAKAIVSARDIKPIETTFDLVKVIESTMPESKLRNAVGGAIRKHKINPATKTFQALRIAVNDELGALEQGLAKGYEALRQGGRMAVISFHSLEDRIVKDFMRSKKASGSIVITKKPITATYEEISMNPRSRSAKLRILERNDMR
jgi:16S rRNA (cytosine1402-N4)-methyltransferase